MSEFLACIMGSRLTATQSSVTRPLSTTVKLEVQIRSEWGKTCSLAEKKTFHRAISAFLALFTKPQVVLTCFDRFLITFYDVRRPVGVRKTSRITGAKPREI